MVVHALVSVLWPGGLKGNVAQTPPGGQTANLPPDKLFAVRAV